MTGRILIIGITGGVGTAVAEAAMAAGYAVRALHRTPEKIVLPASIEVMQGDAMIAEDICRAAEGCAFILHAANPPGYRNWGKVVIPMARNAAAAAKAVNARLLVPGNIYNFGHDAFPVIREGAVQRPVSTKGCIRVAMEQALQHSGARVTILRAGDFFGEHAPSAWFQSVMLQPGKPQERILWPGSGNAGHSFAYLPDMAATFVALMRHEASMARFEDLNFAGHYFDRGREFAERLAVAAGLTAGEVRRFPWELALLAWPFVPVIRQIAEMRYLWQVDARLDNSRLLAHIGAEPHTHIDLALQKSLKTLGCLQQPLEASAAMPIVESIQS